MHITYVTIFENTKAGIEQISRGHAHNAVSIRVNIENPRKLLGTSPVLCEVTTTGCCCITT